MEIEAVIEENKYLKEIIKLLTPTADCDVKPALELAYKVAHLKAEEERLSANIEQRVVCSATTTKKQVSGVTKLQADIKRLNEILKLERSAHRKQLDAIKKRYGIANETQISPKTLYMLDNIQALQTEFKKLVNLLNRSREEQRVLTESLKYLRTEYDKQRPKRARVSIKDDAAELLDAKIAYGKKLDAENAQLKKELAANKKELKTKTESLISVQKRVDVTKAALQELQKKHDVYSKGLHFFAKSPVDQEQDIAKLEHKYNSLCKAVKEARNTYNCWKWKEDNSQHNYNVSEANLKRVTAQLEELKPILRKKRRELAVIEEQLANPIEATKEDIISCYKVAQWCKQLHKTVDDWNRLHGELSVPALFEAQMQEIISLRYGIAYLLKQFKIDLRTNQDIKEFVDGLRLKTEAVNGTSDIHTATLPKSVLRKLPDCTVDALLDSALLEIYQRYEETSRYKAELDQIEADLAEYSKTPSF